MGASQPEEDWVVEFDDREIKCRQPNGEIQSVRWDQLESVVLQNTDEGPFAPDIFWVLIGSEGGCVVPQGAVGEEELASRLQELPGFDDNAAIASATCADNQDFLCWKKAEP